MMMKKLLRLLSACCVGMFAWGCTCVFAQSFELKSESFLTGTFTSQQILSSEYGFGCEGENISPRLHWDNPPEGTKSFVLTIYDPDAPTGIGWMHWVVVNIPATVREISAGAGNAPYQALPEGALQTRTDFGNIGYGGACPPQGQTHRYVITLTALDVEHLDVGENTMPALVGFMLQAHRLQDASITVQYGR